MGWPSLDPTPNPEYCKSLLAVFGKIIKKILILEHFIIRANRKNIAQFDIGFFLDFLTALFFDSFRL